MAALRPTGGYAEATVKVGPMSDAHAREFANLVPKRLRIKGFQVGGHPGQALWVARVRYPREGDVYQAAMRLCDENGTVWASGYPCTGHAHQEGLHIRCDNPIHVPAPTLWGAWPDDIRKALREAVAKLGAGGCPAGVELQDYRRTRTKSR